MNRRDFLSGAATGAMFDVSEEVNAATVAEGELNRRIYESWSAFRKRAMDDQPLSDFGFIRNRARARDA